MKYVLISTCWPYLYPTFHSFTPSPFFFPDTKKYRKRSHGSVNVAHLMPNFTVPQFQIQASMIVSSWCSFDLTSNAIFNHIQDCPIPKNDLFNVTEYRIIQLLWTKWKTMKSIAYSNFLAWKFLIIQCSSLFHRFPGSVWSPSFFSFPTFSKLPNKEKQSIKAPSFLSFFCLCVKTQKFYLVSSFPTIPQQPNREKLVKPSSIISSTSKRKRPKIVKLF